MKHALLIGLSALISVTSMAVPAKRTTIALPKDDGSTVSVQLVGDEFFHYYVDASGRKYSVNSLDQLVEFPEESFQAARQMGIDRFHEVNQQRMERLADYRNATSASHAANTGDGPARVGEINGGVTGSKKGLIILVNFADKSFRSTNNQEMYYNMANQVGFNKNGHIGSVHDFFADQSYNQFDLTFDVAGPYTLSHGYSYYGENSGSSGNDKRAAEMIIEAVQMADPDVNYADYDWMGDGYVDMVFVIYAGPGEASGGAASTIWPHQYDLYSASYYGNGSGPQHLDGKTISTYACSCEISGGASSTSPMGIGVVCHEFSHCLGYPDVYDTDYSGAFGMSYFSILDGGSYNGPNGRGEVPCGYGSYERWVAGWMEPIELTEPCHIEDMPSLGSSPTAYIVYNQKNRNEYYLLENRQATDKWFSYVSSYKSSTYKCQGMLIVHIDYNASVWARNGVNDDPNHQRMTIFHADNSAGQNSLSDFSGDFYPGTRNNRSLTDTSTPAATLYNANQDGRKFMGKPIENITMANAKISFDFDGGKALDTPVLSLDQVEENNVTLSWEAVASAESYAIKVLQHPLIDTTLTVYVDDDMSLFVAEKDGTSDLSKSLDNYTKQPGWKGSRVYKGVSGAKIGSTLSTGYLMSPAFEMTGEVIVQVNAVPFGQNEVTLDVVLTDATGKTLATQTVAVDGETAECHFPLQEGGARIKFTPSARAYIRSVNISSHDDKDVTRVVTGITGTSYVFEDLERGNVYTFWLQAQGSIPDSEWSELVTVTIEAPEETNALLQLSEPELRSDRNYDLSGRRSRLSRGLQIINGQLIFVK